MKGLLIVGVVLILLAGCAGMTPGSGHLSRQSFDLDGFSKIDANSAAEVEVTLGEGFAVEVEVDDNLVDVLDVAVRGDTLHIRLESGPYYKLTLRARVTMPKLTGVTLNGASELSAELAGEDVAIDLNGASELTLTGSAGRVTLVANGASHARLGDLDAGDITLDVNGASDVEVRSHGAVRGTANGASDVVVRGDPTGVDVTSAGSSRVVTR